MEKYSQFRDRGKQLSVGNVLYAHLLIIFVASGIAPFLPVVGQVRPLNFVVKLALFCVRLPLFAFTLLAYFGLLQWLPLGSLGKKACLWAIAGIAGIWWVDLQIEGVKKGSLARHHSCRLPQPKSIIASSFTSPIDSLYLAAVFDPIFTITYPSTAKVRRISLLQAILHAFSPPETHPTTSADLTDLSSLLKQYPNQCLVIYPECTTTNGKGILKLSSSIASAPAGAKIFPISLRYTPADITTPIPRSYLPFLWKLLSQATHCIRVGIAENITVGEYNSENATVGEQQILVARIGDALAKLARVKRVGLGVREKQEFMRIWSKNNMSILG
ncbi:Lysophosphatidic acid:oleoyl-CoA acyltransferase 1 [Emydomyces testavorans]|uniref:Lysophosphatidic acid:oleoyl-CoA acyltransferase 1 n=1 Tax=Emydomyces testavorans TaxID=2070801 RepID=A0AAF0DF42_9EURO|nr:Lysophosphatidic acid:oleoyl-CoA acyltransferase 1 [Emydomyces testavorans]